MNRNLLSSAALPIGARLNGRAVGLLRIALQLHALHPYRVAKSRKMDLSR
jgi:hypothetical protein